jgi:hypothetical protein
MRLIERLFSSLSAGDAGAAADCYTSDAYFQDIAFRLNGRENIRNMWRMVCHAKVTVVKFHADFADDETGRGRWVADYIFDRTESSPGRRVISKISSEFVFRSGEILRHHDHVDPMVWAKQAYPFPKSLSRGPDRAAAPAGRQTKARKIRQ